MKHRPGFRFFLFAFHAVALSLLWVVPTAFAQTTSWRARATNRWEAREDAGRFLPDTSPWWWDLPAFQAAAPQPQAAGQDLYVNGSTYTVSGNEQWANVYVSEGSDGFVVQNPGTTMTISGSLVLGHAIANAAGSYTLNGGALSASTERIGSFANGTSIFTQNGGTNSVGSGGLTLSQANGFGIAVNTGVYTLNGGTLSTPFVAKGGGANGTFNFKRRHAPGHGQQRRVHGRAQQREHPGRRGVHQPQRLRDHDLPGPGRRRRAHAERPGTLTLTGANTYTGGTALSGGTLSLAAPGRWAAPGRCVSAAARCSTAPPIRPTTPRA